ncbi:MAG: LPS-assembly protein LptD [bacterium]|nr:LPS-assembly protein LptD [bacterium]
MTFRGWWGALACGVAGLVVCAMAQALPFTIGSPVPLDIERTTVAGKDYNVLTLSRVGDVRPTILYGDASFMADRITYDELSAQITAFGNVRATVGPQLLLGEHLEYNLDARRGILTNANMRNNEIHVSGGKIEIREIDIRDKAGVEQAYSYEILDGTITACEYAIPHYHLEADFFRVVPEARVWLYGALYRVIRVPIFYFPYLTRSLRKEPYAQVIQAGVDSNKGFTWLNRFHFHYNKVIHPLLRGTLYADYFSKQGVGVGGRWNYLNQKEAPSYIHGYFIDQKDNFDENQNAKEDTEGSRSKVAFQHFQRFNQEWTLTGKGKVLSDPDFDEDYDAEELIRGFSREDLTNDRYPFLNLARTRTNSNFRLITKHRLQDFNVLEFQEDERDEVVYDSKRRPITGTDFYHRFRFSAGNYASRQTVNVDRSERVDRANIPVAPGDTGVYELETKQDFQRANISGEVNRPLVFETFTLIPFLSLDGTAYSNAERNLRVETVRGDHLRAELDEEYDSLLRGILSGGVEFTTRRAMRFDDPAAGIERRLLLEPGIGLVGRLPTKDIEDIHPDSEDPVGLPALTDPIIRSRDPRLADNRIPGWPVIDEVDSIRDEFFGFEFRLETRYQTRKAGGNVRDVVVASLSTALDFTETDRGEEEFATVFGELFVNPFEWLGFTSYLEYEPNGSFVRSFRNAVTWRPTEPLALTTAYSEFRVNESVKEAEQEVTVTADLALSSRYRLSYSEFYDINDSITRQRRFVLGRDFHDWILDVGVRESRRETKDRSIGAYFSLTLKTPKGVQGVPGLKSDEEAGGLAAGG